MHPNPIVCVLFAAILLVCMISTTTAFSSGVNREETEFPKPAVIKDIVNYECTGTTCSDSCTLVPFPPKNDTYRANCVISKTYGYSVSYWIYSNGTLAIKTFFNNEQCSGTSYQTAFVQTGQCILYGGNSTVVYYTNAPAPLTPAPAPVVKPKPAVPTDIRPYACSDTNCMNCTLEVYPPVNSTVQGNCVFNSQAGYSESVWIFPNGTILVEVYSDAQCSGSTVAVSAVQPGKCRVYGSRSSILYYTNEPAPPTPVPTPVVKPNPAVIQDIRSYTCTDTTCTNCTQDVFPPPNSTVNGNCVVIGSFAESIWIFPNGTLMSNAFERPQCSGAPVQTDLVQPGKCRVYGSESSIVYYSGTVPPPAPPASNTPKPVVLTAVKPFVCYDTTCTNCTLKPFPGPNMTAVDNCVTNNVQQYSESLWIYKNGTMALEVFTSTQCFGSPTNTVFLQTDKCVVYGDRSEVIYYTAEN